MKRLLILSLVLFVIPSISALRVDMDSEITQGTPAVIWVYDAYVQPYLTVISESGSIVLDNVPMVCVTENIYRYQFSTVGMEGNYIAVVKCGEDRMVKQFRVKVKYVVLTVMVTFAGQTVDAKVQIFKDGKPYAEDVVSGTKSFSLPVGKYTIIATAMNAIRQKEVILSDDSIVTMELERGQFQVPYFGWTIAIPILLAILASLGMVGIIAILLKR
jgi:hypothetical protein